MHNIYVCVYIYMRTCNHTIYCVISFRISYIISYIISFYITLLYQLYHTIQKEIDQISYNISYIYIYIISIISNIITSIISFFGHRIYHVSQNPTPPSHLKPINSTTFKVRQKWCETASNGNRSGSQTVAPTKKIEGNKSYTLEV